MKFSAAAALAIAAPALAQSSSNSSMGNSSAYLQQVLGALEMYNLTTLVQAASGIANSSMGQQFLMELASGNKTVFAPTNQAFSQLDQSMLSNTTLLTEVLSYHVLNNTVTANGTQLAPNHTIVRTLLNGGMYMLPGNVSAPVVLSRNSTNGTSFMINEATMNVSTLGGASAANLMVYLIDEVLSLPMSVTDTAAEVAPSLGALLNQTMLAQPLESLDGITVFAPNDGAIDAVMSALGSLNATMVGNVLANHVINGSVVYSNELYNGNWTSAGGEQFTFKQSNGTWTVSSGNSTANILQSDVILNNGVLYVIDNVLVNPMSNPSAAASAQSSYSEAAKTMTATTGALTQTSQAGSSSSGSSSGGKSAASTRADLGVGKALIAGLVGVVGVIVGGGFAMM